MLQQSFIILDRVGTATEKGIWQQKILDWNDFLQAKSVKGIGKTSKAVHDRQIERAKQSLKENNCEYFNRLGRERWRAYDWFSEEAAYLDIETGYHNEITVVGIYDGQEVKTMIRGINLDYRMLETELSKYSMIVTFNGASFDLPMLSKHIQLPKALHYDLRPIGARLGYVGGLKAIEKEVGITRSSKLVQGMNGGDAAELWRIYMATGDEHFLNILVDYNSEDIINLKPLARKFYNELKSKTLVDN